jgi:hypothetical protein
MTKSGRPPRGRHSRIIALQAALTIGEMSLPVLSAPGRQDNIGTPSRFGQEQVLNDQEFLVKGFPAALDDRAADQQPRHTERPPDRMP